MEPVFSRHADAVSHLEASETSLGASLNQPPLLMQSVTWQSPPTPIHSQGTDSGLLVLPNPHGTQALSRRVPFQAPQRADGSRGYGQSTGGAAGRVAQGLAGKGLGARDCRSLQAWPDGPRLRSRP